MWRIHCCFLLRREGLLFSGIFEFWVFCCFYIWMLARLLPDHGLSSVIPIIQLFLFHFCHGLWSVLICVYLLGNRWVKLARSWAPSFQPFVYVKLLLGEVFCGSLNNKCSKGCRTKTDYLYLPIADQSYFSRGKIRIYKIKYDNSPQRPLHIKCLLCTQPFVVIYSISPTWK